MGAEAVPALVLQLLHHLVHGALQPRFHSNARLPQEVQASLSFRFNRLRNKSRINKRHKQQMCQQNLLFSACTTKLVGFVLSSWIVVFQLLLHFAVAASSESS